MTDGGGGRTKEILVSNIGYTVQNSSVNTVLPFSAPGCANGSAICSMFIDETPAPKTLDETQPQDKNPDWRPGLAVDGTVNEIIDLSMRVKASFGAYSLCTAAPKTIGPGSGAPCSCLAKEGGLLCPACPEEREGEDKPTLYGLSSPSLSSRHSSYREPYFQARSVLQCVGLFTAETR